MERTNRISNMEIIRGITNLKDKTACAVTVGTFDGVHLGHLKIIERLNELAAKENLCSTLVTFCPHPKIIVNPMCKDSLKLLTTIEEKIKVLQKTGLDRLVIIDFDLPFSRLSYKQFVQSVLVDKLGAEIIVVGYDHAFGKDREGDYITLSRLSREYDFLLEKVNPYKVEDKVINSTLIRETLQQGKVELANKYLGRSYFLTGTVVKGSGRGRDLKFPTANIAVENPYKFIPANGVFAVDVEYDNLIYKGMLNIGYKPTFSAAPAGGRQADEKRSIETHIFNFNKNIYQKELTVYFKKRLRSEKKFDTIEALTAQLEIDKQESLNL